MSKLRENLEEAKVKYFLSAFVVGLFSIGVSGFSLGMNIDSNDLSKESWKRIHHIDLENHRKMFELSRRIEELEKENEDLRSLQAYEWDEGWEDAMEMMGDPPYADGC